MDALSLATRGRLGDGLCNSLSFCILILEIEEIEDKKPQYVDIGGSGLNLKDLEIPVSPNKLSQKRKTIQVKFLFNGKIYIQKKTVNTNKKIRIEDIEIRITKDKKPKIHVKI